METQEAVAAPPGIPMPEAVDNTGYVHLMAATLGVKTSPELVATLAVLDKNAINTQLAAQAAQAGQETQFTEQQRKTLLAMGDGHKEKVRDNIERNKRRHLENALAHQADANQHLENAAAHGAELLRIDGNTVDIEGQIKEVLKNPFFSFHDARDSILEFTTAPVILQWEKKAAGVKHKIDLGQFLVRLELAKAAATILPYKDNVKTDGGYLHPHIQNDQGRVCWGNAAHGIAKMASEYNIIPAMEAVEAFLHTYNEGSTYADIYRFYEKRLYADKLKDACGTRLFDEKYLVRNAHVYIIGFNAGETRINGVPLIKLAAKMEDPHDAAELLTFIDSEVVLTDRAVRRHNLCVEALYVENNYYVRLTDGSYAKAGELFSSWGARHHVGEYVGLNKGQAVGYIVSRYMRGDSFVLSKAELMKLQGRKHAIALVSEASLSYILDGNFVDVPKQTKTKALATNVKKSPRYQVNHEEYTNEPAN